MMRVFALLFVDALVFHCSLPGYITRCARFCHRIFGVPLFAPSVDDPRSSANRLGHPSFFDACTTCALLGFARLFSVECLMPWLLCRIFFALRIGPRRWSGILRYALPAHLFAPTFLRIVVSVSTHTLAHTPSPTLPW